MAEEIIRARIVFDKPDLKGVGGKLGEVAGDGRMADTGKSLKNISGSLSVSGKSMVKMGAIMGAASAGIGILVGLAKKLWATVRDASPRLQASLKILGKGIKLALRPIGDLLSMYLRPFALAFLRYAIGFYKWWADNRDTIKKVFDVMLKFTLSPILGLIDGMKSIFKVGGSIYDWITDKLFGEEWSLSDTIKGWLGVDEDVDLWTAITEWLLGDTETGGLWGAIKTWLGIVGKISLLPFVLGFLGITKAIDLGIKILNWLGMDIQWSLSGSIKEWLGLNTSVSLWDAIMGWLGIGGGNGNLDASLNKEKGTTSKPEYDFRQKMVLSSYGGKPVPLRELYPDSPKYLDAFISKGGKIHRISEDDNILAYRGDRPPGGGSVNVTLNVNAMDASSIDSSVLDKISRAVSLAVQRDMFRTTSEASGGF